MHQKPDHPMVKSGTGTRSIDFGPSLPRCAVIYEDEMYPDCVYVEVVFFKPFPPQLFQEVHATLRETYKANFPYGLRVKHMDYPSHFGFIGIRSISNKRARRHKQDYLVKLSGTD